MKNAECKVQNERLRQFYFCNLQFASCIQRSDGIALLMVLWVLTILTAAVLSFSFLSRTDAFSTLAFKEGMERKFLAEAGMERAIMELFYLKQNAGALVVDKDTEAWKADGTPYEVRWGEGSYRVSIMGESGKLDINTVPEVVLKNLLLNHGVKDDEADGIVDCIMDWKDPDDLVRLHGAESDYYMSLPNPYKAKNGDFDTLEELLLVKGVTPELLYGSKGKKGIIDFLTVNSRSNMINVNYAPREVLTAIPGISADAADRIIRYRRDKRIGSTEELQGLLAEGYSAASPYVGTADTNTYTVEAVGYKTGGGVGYPIKAVIAIDNNTRYRYLYYKSPSYKRNNESESDSRDE